MLLDSGVRSTGSLVVSRRRIHRVLSSYLFLGFRFSFPILVSRADHTARPGDHFSILDSDRALARAEAQQVIKSQEAAKQNSVDSAEIPNSREQITMPALLRPDRIQRATKFNSSHPKGAAGESKRP